MLMYYLVVGYMVFILPANIGMRVIGPPRQIGLAVIFFGICGTCLSAVHGYGPILGLRLLIGLGEALVQVGLLYFSFWYKRDEVATRAGKKSSYSQAIESDCIFQHFTIRPRPYPDVLADLLRMAFRRTLRAYTDFTPGNGCTSLRGFRPLA